MADWDEAEGMLKNALNTFCSTNETKWELNPGDGAFYGPKIDIKILDALKRRHQLATIQLDFQLPQRFKLKFVRDNKEETPVMIHRAILGSIERCVAILTESFGGKWPFWLSPRQVRVVPIGKSQVPFAQSIANKLFDAGLEAEADPDCAGKILTTPLYSIYCIFQNALSPPISIFAGIFCLSIFAILYLLIIPNKKIRYFFKIHSTTEFDGRSLSNGISSSLLAIKNSKPVLVLSALEMLNSTVS